jgi:cysteinyl-tRNA synthetase
LGVLQPVELTVDSEVERLVSERQAARAAKDWPQADAFRDQLAALGWAVKDTPDGAKLTKL